jgi:hypothetical protein
MDLKKSDFRFLCRSRFRRSCFLERDGSRTGVRDEQHGVPANSTASTGKTMGRTASPTRKTASRRRATQCYGVFSVPPRRSRASTGGWPWPRLSEGLRVSTGSRSWHECPSRRIDGLSVISRWSRGIDEVGRSRGQDGRSGGQSAGRENSTAAREDRTTAREDRTVGREDRTVG